MSSPPDAIRRRRLSAFRRPLVVSRAMLSLLKIVYNIVFNINVVTSIEDDMAGKPLKRARATKPSPAPDVLAREPAAALVIAKAIEEDIVLGRRQPRERLIEQDLCDLFRTHRGDVRLALFELEKKGLIERIPNRGAMVRGLTPLEVREIYAVREELEVMAVRIIPFPVDHEEINRLEELQRQHSAAVAKGDLLTVFYSNLRFHQVLFGLCGNACLIETIELLAQKVHGIRSYAHAFPQSLDRVRRDHLDMIKALRGSRRDELIALTRRHLEPSPEAYIRAYEQRFGKAEPAPAH
jgi:DNA-binding GntR family transcriptional regulator